MSGLRFRNVDAEPSDDVATWPYEALVTAIDRGLVADWQPIFAEIRRAPRGPVAERVEQYLSYREADGAGSLFALAIARARIDNEAIAEAYRKTPETPEESRWAAESTQIEPWQ